MSDKKKKTITRRQFISNTSMAAIGSTLFLGAPAAIFSKPKGDKKSTVVLIRDKDVLNANGTPNSTVVLEMLDKAVTTITGKKDPVEGWKTFIKPTDIVGIKTNVWGRLPTTSQVEEALKKRVMDVGVKESDIGIADRGIWRDPLFKKATALINARPLRSHHWSGIGGCLKNYIMFVERPWEYHPDACADLGALWNLAATKGKTRLNVLVMLTPLFHGRGPHHFNAQYLWPYRGLIVTKDPVAADRVGLEILRAQRRKHFGKDKPFATRTGHVGYADTRHGVGIADMKRIDLVTLGWKQDLLLPT